MAILAEKWRKKDILLTYLLIEVSLYNLILKYYFTYFYILIIWSSDKIVI